MIRCPTDAVDASLKGAAIRSITRLLIAVYLIEAGLLLVVAPLTGMWWQSNFFVDLVPSLRPLMETTIVRGVVMAAGVVTAFTGVSDLRDVIFGRVAPRRPANSRQTPDA